MKHISPVVWCYECHCLPAVGAVVKAGSRVLFSFIFGMILLCAPCLISICGPSQLLLSSYSGRSLCPNQQGAVPCSPVWPRAFLTLTSSGWRTARSSCLDTTSSWPITTGRWWQGSTGIYCFSSHLLRIRMTSVSQYGQLNDCCIIKHLNTYYSKKTSMNEQD